MSIQTEDLFLGEQLERCIEEEAIKLNRLGYKEQEIKFRLIELYSDDYPEEEITIMKVQEWINGMSPEKISDVDSFSCNNCGAKWSFDESPNMRVKGCPFCLTEYLNGVYGNK